MIKVNTNDVNINGTSLVGYITTTYNKLVNLFGDPCTDYDKSTAHWNIQAQDGTVVTIYDYKEYSTPTSMYRWHVGGHSEKALQLVEFLTGVTPSTIYDTPWNPYGGGCDGDSQYQSELAHA